jgi:hypothetical protein
LTIIPIADKAPSIMEKQGIVINIIISVFAPLNLEYTESFSTELFESRMGLRE